MSLNTKIRKRVSFTPIMLSIYHSKQPPNPFVQSIALTINSCATNVKFLDYAKQEMTLQTLSLEIVSISKGWIPLPLAIRITTKMNSCLPKGDPRMRVTNNSWGRWPLPLLSKYSFSDKCLEIGTRLKKKWKSWEKLNSMKKPKEISNGFWT